jgi:hypothetical protein
MVRSVALAGLVCSLSASAQTFYSWTDEAGTTHYTDDLSSVPKGTGFKATSGDPLMVVSAGKQPAKTKVEVAAERERALVEVVKPAEPKRDELNEREWRDAFRQAYDTISTLELKISQDKKKVDSINGLPVTGRYGCYQGPVNLQTGLPLDQHQQPCNYLEPSWRDEKVKDRIAENELALEKARRDLEALERKASFASVPREWRQRP